MDFDATFTVIGYQTSLVGFVPSLLPCMDSGEHLASHPLILSSLGAGDLIHQR